MNGGSGRLWSTQEYLDAGRLSEALVRARRAVSDAPQDAEAQRVLGVVLCHLGHPDEGIEALREALALSPDLHAARRNLAVAYVATADWESAYLTWRSLTDSNPSDDFAHEGAAQAEARLRELGRPIPAYVPAATGTAEDDMAEGDPPGSWSLANAGAIIAHPVAFMDSQVGLEALGPPSEFFAAGLGIAAGLSLLSVIPVVASGRVPSGMLPVGPGMVTWAGSPAMLIMMLPVAFALQFAASGLVHAVAYALGARRRYGMSYRAVAYSATPGIVVASAATAVGAFAPAAVIGAQLVSAAWGVAILAIGLARLHGIAVWRAIVAALAPALALGGVVLYLMWQKGALAAVGLP
jgi:hypothetical protein